MMKGYIDIITREIILEEDAYNYVLDDIVVSSEFRNEILNLLYADGSIFEKTTEELCQWANRNQDEIVEWFFSGNYIKVELDEDGRVIE